MFATIALSSHIYVQGRVVEQTPDGGIRILSAGREYRGRSIPPLCAGTSRKQRPPGATIAAAPESELAPAA